MAGSRYGIYRTRRNLGDSYAYSSFGLSGASVYRSYSRDHHDISDTCNKMFEGGEHEGVSMSEVSDIRGGQKGGFHDCGQGYTMSE